MDRYTRKDAERSFWQLCASLGKRVAGSYNDVGAWTLDYNSVYGGYVVHEISTDGGGVSEPFGSQRRPAREFCSCVNFTIRALEAKS